MTRIAIQQLISIREVPIIIITAKHLEPEWNDEDSHTAADFYSGGPYSSNLSYFTGHLCWQKER